ncbi:c-type cytochrome [Pseudomonas sp.]|uniref:c-type cytochrome n=1 Tax=Pseudomonas sp. TaxID=306 RepID=UPI003C7523FB
MRITAIFTAALALLAAEASAQPPAEAQVCVSCHGAQGEGTALGPVLAGLSAEYIDAQITRFIAGDRHSELMSMMAQNYADPQLRKPVAAYFEAQGQMPKPQLRGQKIPTSAAQKLYYQGDLLRNIPACYSCHGPSAVGGGPFPRLAGQQASYLAGQLQAWQKGERKGDPGNMMVAIAGRLKADEIQALAEYLAAIR